MPANPESQSVSPCDDMTMQGEHPGVQLEIHIPSTCLDGPYQLFAIEYDDLQWAILFVMRTNPS